MSFNVIIRCSLAGLIPSFLSLFLCSCYWTNERSNPFEPVGAWSALTGPATTGSAADSLDLSWRHVRGARLYRVYFVNSWGPPVNETLLASVSGNALTIDADELDYERIYRVKALDGGNTVLACGIVKGFYNQIVPVWLNGPVAESFEGGTVPAFFTVRNATGGAAAAVIDANTLRSNADASGVLVYWGYDPGDNDYVRLSYKTYQYYALSGDFNCGVSISSSANNLDGLIIANSLISSVSRSGVEYYTYDRCEYNPSQVNTAMNSPAVWYSDLLTRTVIINRQTGRIIIRDARNADAGVDTTINLPFVYSSKLVICFIAWSSGAGNYTLIYDISVESSDSPLD